MFHTLRCMKFCPGPTNVGVGLLLSLVTTLCPPRVYLGLVQINSVTLSWVSVRMRVVQRPGSMA